MNLTYSGGINLKQNMRARKKYHSKTVKEKIAKKRIEEQHRKPPV
jgi:hypothetical protein